MCRLCPPCCKCSSKETSQSGMGLRLDLRTCSNHSGLILFLFFCKLSLLSFNQNFCSREHISFLAKGDEMAEEDAEMPVVPHVSLAV